MRRINEIFLCDKARFEWQMHVMPCNIISINCPPGFCSSMSFVMQCFLKNPRRIACCFSVYKHWKAGQKKEENMYHDDCNKSKERIMKENLGKCLLMICCVLHGLSMGHVWLHIEVAASMFPHAALKREFMSGINSLVYVLESVCPAINISVILPFWLKFLWRERLPSASNY